MTFVLFWLLFLRGCILHLRHLFIEPEAIRLESTMTGGVTDGTLLEDGGFIYVHD